MMASFGSEGKYSGFIDIVKKVVSNDGISGLYAGFGISIFGIIIYRGAYFGLYDSFRSVI